MVNKEQCTSDKLDDYYNDNCIKTIDKPFAIGYNKRLEDGFALLYASEQPQYGDKD